MHPRSSTTYLSHPPIGTNKFASYTCVGAMHQSLFTIVVSGLSEQFGCGKAKFPLLKAKEEAFNSNSIRLVDEVN